MARKPAKPKIEVKAGDYVLMGGSYASFPCHWYFAEVLWADATDVLLHRTNQNGTEFYRQVESILHIRAVGTIEELCAIKRQAADAVRELSNAASEAESALGTARAAVHAELDRLAAGGLKFIARDHDAIAQREIIERVAVEAIDAEEAA
jgi:hypothetical protein